jgi:hypothetical protein
MARKIAMPVLTALHHREFYRVFNHKSIARLEAFARVLVGLAPWFEHLGAGEIVFLAQSAIDAMTDPMSADYVSFARPEQALVETALFAQALLRAPNALWHPLPTRVKKNVILALKSSRCIRPHDNNWMLFPSMIETFMASIGEDVDTQRLMEGIQCFQKWYIGDGHYNDGEEFHFDYYNSFIIQPMLIDILETLVKCKKELGPFADRAHIRLQRLATIQERMISPDGTFPPVGRSLTYRCGAFHALALCALKDALRIPAAQARVALTRVIKATLEHPCTFDQEWLTIGLFGQQEFLAEPYITRGSVYMCCTVFLPLGLSSSHPFWTDADVPTTWEQLLLGNTVKRDKPLTECTRKHGRVV